MSRAFTLIFHAPVPVGSGRYYTVLEGDHILYIISRLRAGMKFEMLYGSIFQRCRSSLALTHPDTHGDLSTYSDTYTDAHALAGTSSSPHPDLQLPSAECCETGLVPLREKHADRLLEEREREGQPQQWQQQWWLQHWQWQWQLQGKDMAYPQSVDSPSSIRDTIVSHLKESSDGGPSKKISRRQRGGRRKANENSCGDSRGARSPDMRGGARSGGGSIGGCSGSSSSAKHASIIHGSKSRATAGFPHVVQQPKGWLDLDLGGFSLSLRLPGMRMLSSDDVRGGSESARSVGKGERCTIKAKDRGSVVRHEVAADCACGCDEGSVRDVFHMLELCCPTTATTA